MTDDGPRDYDREYQRALPGPASVTMLAASAVGEGVPHPPEDARREYLDETSEGNA